jgi:hypothetical protein
MKSSKKLGIWMDHSIAHIMKVTNNTIDASILEIGSSLPAREQNMGVHERQRHNKEQAEQSVFFKSLSDVIKDYEDVLLFGPTGAKTELLNLLKDNHHFDNIKIVIKSADKMTENQRHLFVKEYFKMAV